MTDASIATSIRRGLRFILDHQEDDGSWRDFLLETGISTSWTTAYVLTALAYVSSVTGFQLPDGRIERAIAFLRNSAVTDKGWGYNQDVQTDADTTAWAIMALLEWQPQACDRSALTDLLLRYRGPNGGFRTFVDLREGGFWEAEQPDVTATCLQSLTLLGATREEFACSEISLIDARGVDGSWNAYWYVGSAYATLHASRALHQSAASSLHNAITDVDASADCEFDLGCVLEALDATDEARNIAIALIARQSLDGRWISSPFMRVTRPDVEKPWLAPLSSGDVVSDPACLFTTATVLRGLAAHGLHDGAVYTT